MADHRQMRSFLMSVLVVAAGLALGTSVAFAATADGLSPSAAFVLQTDDAAVGSEAFAIPHTSVDEWYSFEAHAGMVYRVTQTWSQDAGARTFLCAPDGGDILSYPARGSGPSRYGWVRATVDGRYYVHQSSYGGFPSGASYTMSVLEMPASTMATIGGTSEVAPEKTPAGGASVRLWRSDWPIGEPIATATADPYGVWSARVTPGEYVVEFDDPSHVRTGEYFDHLTHIRSGDAATPVYVAEGSSVVGIDGTLSAKGRVAGRVAASTDGVGIPGVTVVSRSLAGETSTVSGPDGAFEIDGVEVGWIHELSVLNLDLWQAGLSKTLPYTVGPGGTFSPTLIMYPIVTETVATDTAPPVTSWPGRAPTFRSSVNIALVATDSGGSGVASTHFRIDRGVETTGTGVLVAATGTHSIEFWSVDEARNVESPAGAATFVILPALVATRVSMTANHTVVARRHPIVFCGTVRPDQAVGASVVIYVQRRGSHAWTRLARRSLTRHRQWAFTYRPTSRGTFYLQARFAATDVFAAGSSSYKRFTVR